MNVTTDVGKFAIFPRSLQGRLSHGATALYLALFFYADQEGVCWPGVARLATDINATPRSVQKWLKEMVDAGVLEVTRRRTDAGDSDTNKYHLLTVQRVVNKLREGGEQNAPTGGERNDLQTITNGTKPNELSVRFAPPTTPEVVAYMRERGWENPGDGAEEFTAFYGSKGWMVGSNKMKDWRRAVVTWELKRKKEGKAKGERKWVDVE